MVKISEKEKMGRWEARLLYDHDEQGKARYLYFLRENVSGSQKQTDKSSNRPGIRESIEE